jgi:hypothetical protein
VRWLTPRVRRPLRPLRPLLRCSVPVVSACRGSRLRRCFRVPPGPPPVHLLWRWTGGLESAVRPPSPRGPHAFVQRLAFILGSIRRSSRITLGRALHVIRASLRSLRAMLPNGLAHPETSLTRACDSKSCTRFGCFVPCHILLRGNLLALPRSAGLTSVATCVTT